MPSDARQYTGPGELERTGYSLGEYEVVVNEPGAAFHGLTQEKAEVVNDALVGRVVRIVGGQRSAALWSNRGTYMFHSITLPGTLNASYLSGPWDLMLLEWTGEHASAGSYRTLSAKLIERFDVLPLPELTPCWNCGRWWPQSKLRDVGVTHLGHEERFHESQLECRRCCAF